MRRALLLLAAAALAAAAEPALAGQRAGGLTWRVDPSPFRLVFSDGARTVAAETPASLAYRLTDGTLHHVTALVAVSGSAYTVATDEPGRTATVTVARTAAGAHVAIALSGGAAVGEVHETFAAAPGEHFLGAGERARYVDLAGQAPSLAASAACVEAPVPFFLSSAGYGVYVPGAAKGRFAFPGTAAPAGCEHGDLGGCALAPTPAATQVCVQGDALAYDLYAGGPAAVVSAFTADAGRAAVPPPSLFSLVQWRDQIGGAQDVLGDVAALQSRQVPLGWELVDNRWESDCLGRLTFDPALVPDPAGLIRQLHAAGVRLLLWVSPLVTCPDAYPQDELLPGRGGYPLVDLANPAARAAFEARLRALLALGVDGFKGDRGDESDLGAQQNAYPLLYQRAVADALRAAGAPGASIFRAAWAGSAPLVGGLWAGDQEGSFEGLQLAIRSAATAGVSGFPIWGSDTGGYHGEGPGETPELFLRWAQLSAVSPIFEVGGIGPNATFWQWGEPAVDAFREAAVLHYELFPYLYGLAQAAAATGAPILRPLGYAFPADPGSWGSDLELMVGPSLLAAPVTGPGTTPRVYLPPGPWIDLYAGAPAAGPAGFVRPTPLDRLPLYLRRGSAIRFDFREPQLWPQPWGVDDLGRPGRAGWLYAPAPGRATAPGLSAVLRRRTLRLTFTDGTLERQVLLVGVRVARASVPHVALARLRAVRAGWSSVAGPFPGVVVKSGDGRRVLTVTLA